MTPSDWRASRPNATSSYWRRGWASPPPTRLRGPCGGSRAIRSPAQGSRAPSWGFRPSDFCAPCGSLWLRRGRALRGPGCPSLGWRLRPVCGWEWGPICECWGWCPESRCPWPGRGSHPSDCWRVCVRVYALVFAARQRQDI